VGECLQEIGEYNGVLERCCHPDQIQRVLVDIDALSKSSGIVRAQESTVCICAQSKVTNTDF
jgi:hypothetical protein